MDLKKYIYGHCVSPVRVRVYDTYEQAYVYKDMPCGKCLHCKNTRVNEWTTRLYAQANYSKYVYYITLDYAPFDISSTIAQKLANETAACYHNINSNESYGMHPVVLFKGHLQDFFKRFRKNTGIKIQYFACGEYGTHAKGHGYGRPHFHSIVFSDVEISPKLFEDAWTINDYKIGRVDFHDLRQNGSLDEIKSKGQLSNYNAKFVFKYVCKYLQKDDFQFENLPTIDFHRAYFQALNKVVESYDLFETKYKQLDAKLFATKWCEYIKQYSPFVVCSKRPSIGLKYFEDNVQRFTQKDFRLFGLSKECTAFPLYYVRKLKEQMFSYSAIGVESFKPSSNSRIGNILAVLKKIRDDRTDFQNFGMPASTEWLCGENGKITLCHDGYKFVEYPVVNLHMYDYKNKVFYQFNGYGYNLWSKMNRIGYVKIGYMDIVDVINKIDPLYKKYRRDYIEPMRMFSMSAQMDLDNSIIAAYGCDSQAYDRFMEDVRVRYNNELEQIRKNKLLMQNSKNTF